MADRSTFNGASTNVPWQDTGTVPEGFGNQYARHIKALYDASALPLTSVGGTGDNVTATVDPTLPAGGLRDGMKFGITWTAANSGPMTLKIGSAAAAPVLSADGAVAAPGLAILGGRALLEYVGGAFRVLSGGAGSGGAARYYWQFTSSGTWTKPAGLPDDTLVTVEMWGGGGGAGGGGGGGGGYALGRFRYGDLPASIPVVVATGGISAGNSSTAGGNSTFGMLLSAYGGGPGTGPSSDQSRRGGGGGGELAPGATITGGMVGGGEGGEASTTGNLPGSPAATIYGGGGGGGSRSAQGGAAVFGGAGGSSNSTTVGSAYGGNGGAAGQPGEAPGGGGGRGAAGARGEVRIWI